ncbi:D-glycero-alpha-D-manno-heptose-1,7-bisphosphate 7-phosphatase [Anthocerotibacter panamensis]|uniref:D-glycero-alpha-D-manno-heptose-1,7-bisphosphate 7-phosphatase n=1 Tax=Anthocerotibacter panamensis TaxID=2857077 RepID=UPI001C4046C7|nr:HAD family hydrolase [Anthocerotibacter panamensis]
MRAVFLDRDGVLNIEAGYIHRVEDLHLMPGAAQAVHLLQQAGWFTALVSNQSGPARGYYGTNHVDALHHRLQHLLAQEAGARLDSVAYCPYLSTCAGGTAPTHSRWSSWRKPNTGMFTHCAWRYGVDLAASVMVGDKATDIDMAHNAGLRGVLVTSGFGENVLKGDYQHRVQPNHVAPDLLEAVHWILAQDEGSA